MSPAERAAAIIADAQLKIAALKSDPRGFVTLPELGTLKFQLGRIEAAEQFLNSEVPA